MVDQEVAVAVTKTETGKVLAALTSAALGLPGLDVQAAVPPAKAQGNVQYGYYQEGDDRMQVDIYHGDVTLPVTDRFEFTFSVDRDTYSGATPAFSLPENMTNLSWSSKTGNIKQDAVSAASGGVTAMGLITIGDGALDKFKKVQDLHSAADKRLNSLETEKNTPLDQEKASLIADWELLNPNPGDFPETISGETVLSFSKLNAATYGKANTNLGNTCGDNRACYLENDFVVGSILDPNNSGAHIHPGSNGNNKGVNHHADAPGVYFRHEDGIAFSAINLLFKAPINANNNPRTGPNDFWEILGFNTAVNPNLSSGDGTNYTTRVAYQTAACA